jgi:hypothetical protein
MAVTQGTRKPGLLGIGGAISLAALLFLGSVALGQSANNDSKQDTAKDVTTALVIVVTGGPKNIPIDNASVYLRWYEPRTWRHPKEMEFDLKTDLKGIAKVKDVPRKRIMIQVVKANWKPFGQYYDLDKDEQRIEINLQTPPHWY